MNFSISIIIPTHNRPVLLKEALDSIASQSCVENYSLEVIIVDDASTPPVDSTHFDYSFPITLQRNNTSHGLAYNRDKGVQLATTDYITHLDDDDKLAPNAIDSIALFFKQHQQTEILFLGVEGFGRSEYFQNVQKKALLKILNSAPHTQENDTTYFFKQSLFSSLLNTVPMCFQREVTSKKTWMQTNDLRLDAYFGQLEITQRNHYMQQITGPLRDSEWALYASLADTNIALLNNPIYLQRCEGQGFVSQLAMRDKQVNAQINTKKQLLLASNRLEKLKDYQLQIKQSLENTFFDNAYYQLHSQQNKKQAYQFLKQAFSINKRIKHLSLFIKLLLPFTLIKTSEN